jgi:hypothetical protein
MPHNLLNPTTLYVREELCEWVPIPDLTDSAPQFPADLI